MKRGNRTGQILPRICLVRFSRESAILYETQLHLCNLRPSYGRSDLLPRLEGATAALPPAPYPRIWTRKPRQEGANDSRKAAGVPEDLLAGRETPGAIRGGPAAVCDAEDAPNGGCAQEAGHRSSACFSSRPQPHPAAAASFSSGEQLQWGGATTGRGFGLQLLQRTEL
jgi:hypothetical protein